MKFIWPIAALLHYFQQFLDRFSSFFLKLPEALVKQSLDFSFEMKTFSYFSKRERKVIVGGKKMSRSREKMLKYSRVLHVQATTDDSIIFEWNSSINWDCLRKIFSLNEKKAIWWSSLRVINLRNVSISFELPD